MGIRKWRHRGRERIVLSKIWPDGTRFRRFMPNRTVAKRLETKINYSIVTGTWCELKDLLTRGVAARDANPTIRDFAGEYLRYCQPRNRDVAFKRRNLGHIIRILGDVGVRELTRRRVDQFVDQRLKEGARNSTVNRGLAVLKHMMSLAVQREYLQVHPLVNYPLLKEVQEPLRILTSEEYRQLIEAVVREDLIIGTYTVVLGETGMRKSEGLRLWWDHICGTRGEKVVMIGQTKSGKVRSVPLSNFALAWLDKLVHFIDVPYVFVDPSRRTPWKDPRGPFFRGRAQVDLDWVTFHDLRHFRATQWLMNGVDVRVVKELLGHASIQTTMRYVHYIQTYATKSVRLAQKKERERWGHTTGPGGYKVDTA